MSHREKINEWLYIVFPYNQTNEVIDIYKEKNKRYYKIRCNTCQNIKDLRYDTFEKNGVYCSNCDNRTAQPINRRNILRWYKGSFRLFGDFENSNELYLACTICNHIYSYTKHEIQYIRKACNCCSNLKLYNKHSLDDVVIPNGS